MFKIVKLSIEVNLSDLLADLYKHRFHSIYKENDNESDNDIELIIDGLANGNSCQKIIVIIGFTTQIINTAVVN